MSKLIRQGEANLVSFGQLGSKLIVDNAPTGGEASESGKIVIAIQSLSDESLITSTPDSDQPAGFCPAFSTQPLASGVTVFGRWEAVSVTIDSEGTAGTGQAIVYYE